MWKKILFGATIILVLTDVYYSFIQHYNAQLDGDIPESMLPLSYIEPVFADPFGLKMIIDNTPHAAPNRFFSHWLENRWFNTIPFVLQLVSDPIHSIYISQAIYKTLIQILLIYVLMIITFGSFNPFYRWEHWLVMLFYCSLFQSCGEVRSMGIIDPAVTYTFFYAMPLLFLLLYLLPFIFEEFHNKKMFHNKIISIAWSVIFVLLSNFSGPVNTGAALVFIVIIFFKYFCSYYKASNKKLNIKVFFEQIPKIFWYYLLPLGLIAIYSLYLGKYNTMWQEQIPLKERFSLLPKGIFEMFIDNLGFSILTLGSIINTILLLTVKNEESKKTIIMFGWILFFTFIYVILLPFGGYRYYRPYIIRYDTIISITYAFIFYEVYSSVILFRNTTNNRKFKRIYIGYIIIFVGYFFFIDDPATWRNNAEKEMMYKIARSKENTVLLDKKTSIIGWEAVDQIWKSENAAKCMKRWNITKDEKLFYYKEK